MLTKSPFDYTKEEIDSFFMNKSNLRLRRAEYAPVVAGILKAKINFLKQI